MNAEIFAEWFRSQGHKVVRTSSSYWYEAERGVYQAFPYHWLIQPSEGELHGMLRKQLAIGLRYSTPLNALKGCVSYHVVYEAADYALDMLDRRSQQNVRKGLKNCTVEPIALSRLADEGWLLEKDTQARQGREGINEASWRRRCEAASTSPGFEAWGALANGRLAATLLTLEVDDCCTMLSQQCHRDYLNLRANNALTYVVTQTVIRRPHIRSIFYTLQSLDAPPNVDEFKFRMGYSPRPVRQHVYLHPLIEAFVNESTCQLLERLRLRYPENQRLAKAHGMLVFQQKGKIPAERQEWPECLNDLKANFTQDLSTKHKSVPPHGRLGLES